MMILFLLFLFTLFNGIHRNGMHAVDAITINAASNGTSLARNLTSSFNSTSDDDLNGDTPGDNTSNSIASRTTSTSTLDVSDSPDSSDDDLNETIPPLPSSTPDSNSDNEDVDNDAPPPLSSYTTASPSSIPTDEEEGSARDDDRIETPEDINEPNNTDSSSTTSSFTILPWTTIDSTDTLIPVTPTSTSTPVQVSTQIDPCQSNKLLEGYLPSNLLDFLLSAPMNRPYPCIQCSFVRILGITSTSIPATSTPISSSSSSSTSTINSCSVESKLYDLFSSIKYRNDLSSDDKLTRIQALYSWLVNAQKMNSDSVIYQYGLQNWITTEYTNDPILQDELHDDVLFDSYHNVNNPHYFT